MRLLCKLREPEILEPLVPSLRTGLEHRHAFVRKNAVFSLYTIHKNLPNLIPDAADLIAEFLEKEIDVSCKRNAFIALCDLEHSRALNYLKSVFSQLNSFDENMQLAVIELIKKDSQASASVKAGYLNAIVSMLESSTAAVRFEAANTLVHLTSSISAVQAVAKSYIDLAVKESDNNVKLIVLDRLDELRRKHDRVLDDFAMDILKVLSSSDIVVCRKAVNMVVEMLATRNVNDIIGVFKKELTKTNDASNDKSVEYRQLLILAIHQCAIKHPQCAPDVVNVLMEFLGDSDSAAAVEVIMFVREVVERNESLRKKILYNLLEAFREMKVGKVLRGALWISGEYCYDLELIRAALDAIRDSIGKLPIVSASNENEDAGDENDTDQAVPRKPTSGPTTRVLADGTYATESAITMEPRNNLYQNLESAQPPLRSLIISGDYFLAAVLANTVTKLVLRASKLPEVSKETLNGLRAESMLIITSIIRAGKSTMVNVPIDEDSYDRMLTCMRILANPTPSIEEIFLHQCRKVFSEIVKQDDKKKKDQQRMDKKENGTSLDDLMVFRHFQTKNSDTNASAEYSYDIQRATGRTEKSNEVANRLNRIVQLTGFSDPVYAEAFVDVHQFDILLDVLIVNQTSETLHNLTIEFATLGDLKLIERPAAHNMAPYSFHSIKANVKVSSTETGVIFGNIVYDSKGSADSDVIILNDIHIDIMDYIKPGELPENQFRSMWTEFEWENKITVNTNLHDLRKFLDHVLKSTNMACLTPSKALEGDCGYLAANVYAKSIFGEDALANICLEQHGDEAITGHIRIRSKTQGIALSLGDKITLSQKVKV